MQEINISFAIPIDALTILKIGEVGLVRQMRYGIAKKYFLEKRLSLGKAASIAEMNRPEFMDKLCGEGVILFDYDESD